MNIPLVKSAGRTLEILEIFRQRKTPLSASRVSEALGIPLSSTSVLLRCLTKLGYLTKEPRKRVYFPTVRVTDLGNWITESSVVDPKLITLAKCLHGIVGETISLTIPSGQNMEIVYILLAKHPITLSFKVGATLPICQSTVGYAWLTTLDEKQVLDCIGSHNVSTKRGDQVRPDELLRTVRKHRQKGYVEGFSPLFPGFSTICFPLLDSVRQKPVILGVAGLADAMQKKKCDCVHVIQESLSSDQMKIARPFVRA